MEAHVRKFSRFAQYDTWCNGRLFDCVEKLLSQRGQDVGVTDFILTAFMPELDA